MKTLSDKRMKLSYNGKEFRYGCRDEDVKQFIKELKEPLIIQGIIKSDEDMIKFIDKLAGPNLI